MSLLIVNLCCVKRDRSCCEVCPTYCFLHFCACDEIDDIVGVACKCVSDVVCFVVH